MTCSFNELESLLVKAAVGAGFPVGHATAISAAGVWLARRRFPVCDVIARAISPGMDCSVLEREAVVAQQPAARAAVDGLGAIDLLVAGAEDTIELTDLDEPLLLLGLAGTAAELYEIGFELAGVGWTHVIGRQAGMTADDFAPIRNRTVTVTARQDAPSGDGAQLAARYDPISTGDSGWQQLESFAQRTYVPASDQSRLSGAGAGLTDND